MRVIVPYVEPIYVRPISVVHTPKGLVHARRVVKPSVQLKAPFFGEFDSRVSLKDVVKSCYAPWPFDDDVDSVPNFEELIAFN